MGRCAWAGWRGVAYTNVDTARRMRGCFSASDERFVAKQVRGSRGWKFLFLACDRMWLEAPASDLPWGPRAAPAPVPAHLRTSIHGQLVDKARLF